MIDIDKVKARILSLAFSGNFSTSTEAEKINPALEEVHKSVKKYVSVSTAERLVNVPDDWKWSRIGYVTFNHGQKKPEHTFCYIDVGTLDNKHQKLSVHENIVEAKDAPSRARKIIEPGDVLYSTVRPYLHNICIINKRFSHTPIASTAFCVMHANEKVLLNKFLFYWLLVPEFDKFANGNPSKGMLYPAISEKTLLNGVIPIPRLCEQHKIVGILDEAFNLLERIDNTQDVYAKDIDIFKSKVIDAGIQGKLTEQLPEDGNAEDLYQQIQAEKAKLVNEGKIKKSKPLPPIKPKEIPFEIPKNWKWVRWGNLSQSIQYGYNAPAKENGRIKMVRITDIQDEKVVWNSVPYCDIEDDNIDTYLLRKNDILFARTGGTVGKSYLVKKIPEESIYAGYLIRTRYSDLLCPEYLKLFMESQLYWGQLHSGTIAFAQPNCNGKTLSKMLLPLPPLDEQKRIADKIYEILAEI